MRRPSRILVRLVVAAFALLLLLVVALMLLPDPSSNQRQLPFDTNGYVTAIDWAPVYYQHAKLPPNPSARDLVNVGWMKLRLNLGYSLADPSKASISGGMRRASIQEALDECGMISGRRYLMSKEIARAGITFGMTNAWINGRDYIDQVESALKETNVEHLISPSGEQLPEHLVLIRYPKQRAVLVLTATEAAEFRRTNSTGVIDRAQP